MVVGSVEHGAELPQRHLRFVREQRGELADAVPDHVDQPLVAAGRRRAHGAGHVDGDQHVRPPVRGVPAGEHVVDVVRAEDAEQGRRHGRRPVVEAGRGARLRPAEAGLGQRSVRIGTGEGAHQPVERRGPGRVRHGSGGREPAVAQRGGVVGRGNDDRLGTLHPLLCRREGVLGHQAHLAGRLRQRRFRAGHRPSHRQGRGQRLGGGVHARLLPHGFGEGAEAEHAVARPARVAGGETHGLGAGGWLRDEVGQAQPSPARVADALRRVAVGDEVDRAGGEYGARPRGRRLRELGRRRSARPAGVVRDPHVGSELVHARRRRPAVRDRHVEPRAVRSRGQRGSDAVQDRCVRGRRHDPQRRRARRRRGRLLRLSRHGHDRDRADHAEGKRADQRDRTRHGPARPSRPPVPPHARYLFPGDRFCGEAL